MGKRGRLNKLISKWIKSELPEDPTTVLLLAVTRIPTSPPPTRRPQSLPLRPSEPHRARRNSPKARPKLTQNGEDGARSCSEGEEVTPCNSRELTPTALVMDKSVDSIGTCSLDVEASGEVAASSNPSSVGTLRSVSAFSPSPEQPHLPSYISLACTVNGYSTTTNYDPERLSKSREASPHRPHNNDSDLTAKTYAVHNNLLSPPNLVPLPVKGMADQTMTQQIYRTSKTMTFMSKENHGFARSVFVSDTVDACYENGVYGSKVTRTEVLKSSNGQKFASESVKETLNGKESMSFIQQRVERLYGPGALAQGFFVSKRQQRGHSESENDKNLKVSVSSKHSKSMTEKLFEDDEFGMRQSTSSPTLPVLRHLRPEFRAQLPIISPRKGSESVMQKSITVPTLKEEVNGVNGHSQVKVEAVVRTNGTGGDTEEESGIKDGRYFLVELEKETDRLLKLADQTEKEANNEHLPEEIKGKLRSAYGKARLLVSQKMEQFKGLCSNNINQSKDEQFPTTNEDLQGFWDMVMLQVVQVNELFEEIDAIKKNNWQLRAEDRAGKMNGSSKKSSKKQILRPKTSGSEELRKQRDAQRKQMMEDRRKAMKAQKAESDKNVEIFVPELS